MIFCSSARTLLLKMVVLKTTRRLLCAPRFNYSAKDVPAEIAKVITQNEWRSLLNQLNNPMLKNSIGPFKWFLWVLLSHFHLLNAITLSEEQYAENGYSFSSPLISYVFGLLIMGFITLYYSLKRSSAMASLAKSIRSSSRINVSVESHGLFSRDVTCYCRFIFR